MSEKLGPRTFGKREELVFLGREISEQRDYSDSVAEIIDSEVRGLIDNGYQTAKRLLTSNVAMLTKVAKYLIDNETVEGDTLNELFASSPGGSDAAPASAG